VRRVVHSRPGSAPRLSQPLSGLLASSSSTALFRAATVPGLPSFRSELSPRKRSRTPLGAAYSPAVIHRRAETRPPGIRYTAVVSPTPALTRSRLDPPRTRVPFQRASSPPGRPGSRVAEPPRSASFTCFEVFVPPASPFAPPRASPGRRPMLSWLSPSTAFSAYASGPHDPPGPGAPRASTLALGHPRTPVSTRRTGTRPSLPAGHPTARTRPGPLTRHAPTLPRARGAQ
jgi:hypothetical protein